jgi:hypothetical protein
MDSETVAVFEEVAVRFLIDHVEGVADEKAFRFLYVQVTSQSVASIKSSRHLTEKLIDLDVAFVVGADVDEDVSKDFQWVVETIFETNMANFFGRLERASAFFEPSGVEASPPAPQQTGGTEIKAENTVFFNTWVIACLAAVGLSIFVSAALVARATRRNAQRELGQSLGRSIALSTDDEDACVSNVHSGETVTTKSRANFAAAGSSEAVEVHNVLSNGNNARMVSTGIVYHKPAWIDVIGSKVELSSRTPSKTVGPSFWL